MTKKILELVVAVMMVMALSVTVFANVDVTADIDTSDNTCYKVAIPEGVDVSNGATVTIHIKGTSNNAAIRVYLSDAADNGRVNEITPIDVVDGAFDGTVDIVIDSTGAVQGTADPTHIILKAESYGVVIDGTFELVEIVTADDAAPEVDAEPEAPAAEPEPEAPAAEPEAPAAEPAPAPAPATGLALAVVPAVMALAAVAVSKKH